MLCGVSKSFKVGKTTFTCTKGLLILKKKIEIQREGQSPLTVIFMDTEGTDGPNLINGKDYDARIFMLAMLLSSHLLYNFTGLVDA